MVTYDALTFRLARALRRCVLAVFGLIACGQAAAQSCYEWAGNQLPTTTYTSSVSGAIQQVIAYCSGGSPTVHGSAPCASSTTFCPSTGTPSCAGWAIESGPTPNAVFPAFAWVLGYDATNNVGTVTHRTVAKTVLNRANPQGCPACPSSGTRRSSVMADGPQSTGTGVCGSDGCQYVVRSSATTTLTTGGFQAIQTVEANGAACGQTANSPAEEGNTEDECIASGGDTACWNSTNCGEINGDRVCLGTVPPNGCVAYASGGVACVASASSPPAPDNGTPGTPATPTATVARPGQTTINYYNSTTVNNSSAPPTTGPPLDDPGAPIGDGEGDCDPETEECGDDPGSAEGGETCDAAPVCEGDPIQCAILDQEWRNRCPEEETDEYILEATGVTGGGDIDGDGVSEGAGEGLPDGGSVADIGADFDDSGWLSGRTCPGTYSVNLGSAFGGTVSVDFTSACGVLAAIGYIVLALGYYMAGRIVVGGF